MQIFIDSFSMGRVERYEDCENQSFSDYNLFDIEDGNSKGRQRLKERYGYPLHLTPDEIRPTYKRTEKAIDSVPQAISCALHSTSFEDAIRNAVSLGGDSDTIAAIKRK